MLNECTHKSGSGKRTVIVCEGQFQVFKQQFSQLKTDLDIRNKPVSVFFSFFFFFKFRANIDVFSSHTPALAHLKNPIHPELKGD